MKPLKVEALERPLSIDRVHDGRVYAFGLAPLVQTNLFFRIGYVDEMFIKVPSERGLDDYRRFVKRAESNTADIRGLDPSERFDHLEETLERFPGLKPLVGVNCEIAHYLAVHKIQYERLRSEEIVAVPITRFGVLQSRRFFRKLEPALFQARVRGTTLWDMYDFEALEVFPQWRQLVPTISEQLSRLLDSRLVDHIDWNIRNFVLDESDRRLFYVDLKPTLFVDRHSNEHNLAGIRDYFIV